MLQLTAQQRGIDPQLLRHLPTQLVALDAVVHPLQVRQQKIHRLHLAIGSIHAELGLGAGDEIVEIIGRTFQRRAVSRLALAADVQIGIEA